MTEEHPSVRLMDEEHRMTTAETVAKIRRIGGIVNQVEKILLDAEATWGEWGDVIDMFNARTHEVFPSLSVKEIKERYDGKSKTRASENSSGNTPNSGTEEKSGAGK